MKMPNGEKVIEFLNSKWQGARCPLCGNSGWNVMDRYFELREFNDGKMVLSGPNNSIVPVIPITCKNCGNTVFINAIFTGLLEGD